MLSALNARILCCLCPGVVGTWLWLMLYMQITWHAPWIRWFAALGAVFAFRSIGCVTERRIALMERMKIRKNAVVSASNPSRLFLNLLSWVSILAEQHCNGTRCANTGICIQDAWRCDMDNDCGDWSDEKGCGKEAHAYSRLRGGANHGTRNCSLHSQPPLLFQTMEHARWISSCATNTRASVEIWSAMDRRIALMAQMRYHSSHLCWSYNVLLQ